MVLQQPRHCPSQNDQMHARVSDVGRQLTGSFDRVLAALPGRPDRPSQTAKAMGVNVDLACRLLKAVQSDDPLTAMHRMPGPNLLRRVLDGVKRKVGAEVLLNAEAAVANFEQLIAGDRSGLDGLLSDWVPEVRARVEALAKQSVHRGYSLIEGIVSETTVIGKLVHPSAQANRLDKVIVGMPTRVRRIRPSAFFGFAVYEDEGQESGDTTLDGRPIRSPDDILLPQFCSTPLPRFASRVIAGVETQVLDDGEEATGSALSVCYAVRKPAFGPRPGASQPEPLTFWVSEENPVGKLIFDVLLHETAAQPMDPSVAVYRPSVRGFAKFGDPRRAGDVMQVSERVVCLGRGLGTARLPSVPSYLAALQHACAVAGWDPDGFRCYRCEIEYPLPGCQVYMAFSGQRPVRTDAS